MSVWQFLNTHKYTVSTDDVTCELYHSVIIYNVCVNILANHYAVLIQRELGYVIEHEIIVSADYDIAAQLISQTLMKRKSFIRIPYWWALNRHDQIAITYCI